MTMLYTKCTACDTIFELTLEEVNLAGGAVRCGVCRTTFNAKRHLRDTPFPVPAAEPATTLPAAGSDGEAMASTVPGAALDAQHGTQDDRIAPPAAGADDGADTRTDAEADNDIDAEAEADADADAEADADACDADTRRDTDTARDGDADTAPDGDADTDGEYDTDTCAAGDADDAADADAGLDALLAGRGREAGTRSLAGTLAWALLAIVLTLLLLAQTIVYWRNDLVQIPHISELLVQANEALGRPLHFDYDPRRFAFVERPRLRLLDDATAAAGGGTAPAGGTTRVLAVTGVIVNRAAVAQPFPWLQLVIEDRWGTPVAARTLQPQDYLARTPNRPPATLGAGASVAVDVRLALASDAVEAFALDVCLPREDGSLNCAAP